MKAHCAFNFEQALPHWVAFRATLKRKASQCDTPMIWLKKFGKNKISEFGQYIVVSSHVKTLISCGF
ncbi:hypothetical protein HMPREF3208_01377 [Gardnerella vaginalis]|uniref:Uncharacterized protein n=1 Tax=Gardnerella vaginalis TaxID=2702 RepID=A0A133NQ37_GARVA|nr:hypothetical protein HMPREF3208_01377 [Gardnerella vaginalis]